MARRPTEASGLFERLPYGSAPTSYAAVVDLSAWEGDCLIWPGSMSGNASPIVRPAALFPRQHPVRVVPVPLRRAIWEEWNGGALPEGWRVWTTCGTWRCVCREHIRAGSYQQWGRAMAKARRFARSPDQIVRMQAAAGKIGFAGAREVLALQGVEPAATVAERFGVHADTVRNIWRGITYRQQAASSVFTWNGVIA